jgi:thioredoxin reductase (NADPH)
LIIATGATAKRLDIPGTLDGEFWQKGVSACAVCDGAAPIFRNKELFVIGGGDSACEEALFLTKFASRVYIVHRRDSLRASKIMAERAMKHPKITILWDSVVTKVTGGNLMEKAFVQNVKTQEVKEMAGAGLFFAIGHNPNTGFLQGQMRTDELGYLVVVPGTSKTEKPGVFAAGDVQDHVYRQAVTAAGSGCMAALDAERWLAEEGLI